MKTYELRIRQGESLIETKMVRGESMADIRPIVDSYETNGCWVTIKPIQFKVRKTAHPHEMERRVNSLDLDGEHFDYSKRIFESRDGMCVATLEIFEVKTGRIVEVIWQV